MSEIFHLDFCSACAFLLAMKYDRELIEKGLVLVLLFCLLAFLVRQCAEMRRLGITVHRVEDIEAQEAEEAHSD
jgi:hypothetical protein